MIDRLVSLDLQRRIGPLNKRWKSAATAVEKEAVVAANRHALATSAAERAFVFETGAPGSAELPAAELDRHYDDYLKGVVLGYCQRSQQPDTAPLYNALAPIFRKRIAELRATITATEGRA